MLYALLQPVQPLAEPCGDGFQVHAVQHVGAQVGDPVRQRVHAVADAALQLGQVGLQVREPPLHAAPEVLGVLHGDRQRRGRVVAKPQREAEEEEEAWVGLWGWVRGQFRQAEHKQLARD